MATYKLEVLEPPLGHGRPGILYGPLLIENIEVMWLEISFPIQITLMGEGTGKSPSILGGCNLQPRLCNLKSRGSVN